MIVRDNAGFNGAGMNMALLSDSTLGQGLRMSDAAGIATGMAFLEGELEKRDMRIREPLTSVTWMRDIVAKTGGGWVDFTSTLNVDYATPASGGNGLVGGQTNDIALMQANVNKDVYPVASWALGMKIPFVDNQKMQTVGRSLDSILDKGIRLNYNKTIDQLVYKGLPSLGGTGLVNDASVTTTTADAGAGTGTPTKWTGKTVDEILWDVNKAIQTAWAASEYDDTALSNHILLPPEQYAYIASTRDGTSGDESILSYLLKNNLSANQGRELYIYPCRWCKGAGTANADSMVVYVNDEDKVYFDLPVPISRVMTQPVALQFAYITIYAAQMGPVKFLYTQPALYVDGI